MQINKVNIPLYIKIMNLNLYLKESRTTRAIDEKSERAKRFLPYL